MSFLEKHYWLNFFEAVNGSKERVASSVRDKAAYR